MTENTEYTSIDQILAQIKEGESVVAVFPAIDKETGQSKGYYIFIGDNWTEHGWAITQVELDKLHELTGKFYHTNK